jgi:hypothetical protein
LHTARDAAHQRERISRGLIGIQEGTQEYATAHERGLHRIPNPKARDLRDNC